MTVRHLGTLVLCLALVGACRRTPEALDRVPEGLALADAWVSSADVGRYGGHLIVSQNGEPRSYNYLTVYEEFSTNVIQLTSADLVHVNRLTQEPEPALARSWAFSKEGKVCTLQLRKGVVFSDGHPFTAADVLFTFEVIYDSRYPNSRKDELILQGRPLVLRKKDDLTVEVEFPAPHGPGVRIFNNIFILPKHKLEASYREGTLASAWGLDTPPGQLVSLGPFILKEYVPAQRIVLQRNPRYWKVDRNKRPLPYLDQVTLLVIPDVNAEFLKFRSGETDLLDKIRPEDYLELMDRARRGAIQLVRVGPTLFTDFLWFNLTPGKSPRDSDKLHWFGNRDFRRAVSHAMDRDSMARNVFLGMAVPQWGPVSPGNRLWYFAGTEKYPYDLDRAGAILEEAGFRDRDGDGWREDAHGHTLDFTILSDKSPRREKIGAILVEDLTKLGVKVRFVPVDFRTMISKIMNTRDYDAGYFGFYPSDVDPAAIMDFWSSGGQTHVWNPGQAIPQTEWEAKVDRWMAEQISTLEYSRRKAIFEEVQKLFSYQLPVIYTVTPELIVASKRNVGNFKPALMSPHLLWNVEELYFKAR